MARTLATTTYPMADGPTSIRPPLMADEPAAAPDKDGGGNGGAAVAEPEPPKPKPAAKDKTKPKPKPPGPQQLPPWKVLLHNDDKNTFEHVILSLIELTPLEPHKALQVTLEADKTGVALVLVTHKERAELYQDQFKSKSLVVTIEPAE